MYCNSSIKYSHTYIDTSINILLPKRMIVVDNFRPLTSYGGWSKLSKYDLLIVYYALWVKKSSHILSIIIVWQHYATVLVLFLSEFLEMVLKLENVETFTCYFLISKNKLTKTKTLLIQWISLWALLKLVWNFETPICSSISLVLSYIVSQLGTTV